MNSKPHVTSTNPNGVVSQCYLKVVHEPHEYQAEFGAYFNEFCPGIPSAPKAKVILFRNSGKYYIEEEWRIPQGAIGPYDMDTSPDFRTIGGGPVLVVTQEPWGYPHLLITKTDLRIPPQRKDNGE